MECGSVLLYHNGIGILLRRKIMIGFQNLHAHTYFDDGSATAEDMVKASIEAGLTSCGICCHSPILTQKNNWCIPIKEVPAFQQEVYAAREKYRGIIDVYCGVELDIMTGPWADIKGFDYVIGAVHYMPLPMGENEFLYGEVDLSRTDVEGYIERIYHGDRDAAAEYYFSQYELVANNKDVDIVAHFDLLTKFDEYEITPPELLIFDETSPRYMAAALEAMRILVKHNKIFEINTGAVSRGYRETFYPSATLLKALRRMGGRITLSTDAHHPANAGFGLTAAAQLAADCGFKEVWNLTAAGFKPVSIKKLLD